MLSCIHPGLWKNPFRLEDVAKEPSSTILQTHMVAEACRQYFYQVPKQSQGCKVECGEYSQVYCDNCVWGQVGTGVIGGSLHKLYNVQPLCCTPETNTHTMFNINCN